MQTRRAAEHEHVTRGILGLGHEIATLRAMVSALAEALIARGGVDGALVAERFETRLKELLAPPAPAAPRPNPTTPYR